MEIVNGGMTGLLIVLFIGIWLWAWSSGNKTKFERMANLPLEDKNDLVEGERNE